MIMRIRGKRNLFPLLLSILALLAVSFGCGGQTGAVTPVAETPTAVPTAEPLSVELETVTFLSGSYPKLSTVLSAVVTAEEIGKLDEFPQLTKADLSGSTCYDEILAYQASHPDVDVIYTVDVGGTQVYPDAESASIAAQTDPQTLIQSCGYLPSLTSLDISAGVYDLAAIRTLASALPQVNLTFEVSYQGETYGSETAELDLSDRTGAEIVGMSELLSVLPNLVYVNLTNPARASGTVACDITLEQLAEVQTACPGVGFDYLFTLFDKQFSTADTTMDLKDINVGKARVDEIRAWLPYMSVCQMVDMDGCNVPNEMMAQLRDDFPNTKVVWRIRFSRYTCRTDAVALRASTANPRMSSSEMQVLKYCTDMEMLDLGHNFQKDLSFVSYMPNLRVAILAMGYVSDLTPLASCTHLEYLELFTNFIVDVSPLAELHELEHLNIAYNRITDISPLYGMTQLKRLWIARNNFPEEQLETLIASLPNTEIDFTSHNPTGGTWRENERYDLLCEQFHYDDIPWRSE